MTARKRGRKAKVKVGMTYAQTQDFIIGQLPFVPSSPWAEAQIVHKLDVAPDGVGIIYRYRDKYVFPPGGFKTKMVRCPECGVEHPPDYTGTPLCLVHGSHGNWGQSPSAQVIEFFRDHNLRIDECKLASEKEDDLLAEIAAFRKKQRSRM